MKTVFVVLVVIGLAVGGAVYYSTYLVADSPARFRTVVVKRGDLLPTISATGTVEPEEVVDVGAQEPGRIKYLGPDPSDPKKKKTIDYGSIVHEGTLLAQIDDALPRAGVNQSQAALGLAQASLVRAQADLLQSKAKRDQAKRDWMRAEELLPLNGISKSDYDQIEANYKSAEANVAVGEATIKQAEATIRQGEATLETAQTHLGYTTIKSPVEGVIVDRRVNVGQTVVASLNAPSLFLIAKDLRRLQVWASVNEADIGRIHVDMPVRFSVDAFPGEVFRGKVSQIRLNATMTQNVVTYTVVVATDNSNGKLLPYLTANLQFELDVRKNVLLVPNAALRWKPRPPQVDPEVRETVFPASRGKGGGPQGSPAGKSPGEAKPATTKEREERGRLWSEDGGFVRPVEVQIGVSDGSTTEVSGSDATEGMEVVIGEVRNDQAADATSNPFAPKLFGQKKAQ